MATKKRPDPPTIPQQLRTLVRDVTWLKRRVKAFDSGFVLRAAQRILALAPGDQDINVVMGNETGGGNHGITVISTNPDPGTPGGSLFVFAVAASNTDPNDMRIIGTGTLIGFLSVGDLVLAADGQMMLSGDDIRMPLLPTTGLPANLHVDPATGQLFRVL